MTRRPPPWSLLVVVVAGVAVAGVVVVRRWMARRTLGSGRPRPWAALAASDGDPPSPRVLPRLGWRVGRRPAAPPVRRPAPGFGSPTPPAGPPERSAEAAAGAGTVAGSSPTTTSTGWHPAGGATAGADPAPPDGPAALPPPGAPARPPVASWVPPEGRECPEGYPVKAKTRSRVYHLPGMLRYEVTTPERCYPSADAAETDGFTRSKR